MESGTVEDRERTDGCTTTQAKTYEEAISETGIGKFHYRILICCGACLTTMIVETLNNSYVSPAAQCDFNMTSSEKGLLNCITHIGMAVSAHLWGFLADTRGRRKMLILSLCFDIICSLIASILPTFLLFVIFRFFNGFFISCAASVAYVYLGEFHSDEMRTKSIMWVSAFLAVGTTSLPVLAWAVIPQDWSFDLPWCTFSSWRIFILLSSIPAISTCLSLWLFVPESPKYLLAAGRKEEALAVLQQVYSVNTGNAKELYPVTNLKFENTQVHMTESFSPLKILKHMWEQTQPVFMPPYLISIVLACCTQFGLYATSNGLLLWMPEIFTQMKEYKIIFPNSSATICTAISYLHDVRLKDTHHQKYTEVLDEILTDQHFNESTESLFESDGNNMSISYQNNLSFEKGFTSNGDNTCQINMSFESFRNALIVGPSCGIGYVFVGYILKFTKKKTVLLICLLATGCSGIAIYYSRTTAELIAFPTIFFTLPAMCRGVINSVVVDAFPTRLRAMALSLSLMVGGIGTISSSMFFGILLEMNCAVIFFLLSGIITAGAILSQFIPVAKSQE